ncbi:Exportin-T [Camellia lanceoleosa]|uniref:Exportin-T n=1 Tax=Camellia lanceoleosa TaxID=1840588 RepID=A0ACC0F996_9ERIC|nr:Exportin-T [Camellia lanceoleosa]
MDDLEKAILISFDELGTVDSVLKSRATAFIQQIKENPSICRICIERLCVSKVVQVRFWCLQCLHEALRVRYSSMSPEEKSFIRKSVFSMACFEGIDDNNNNNNNNNNPVRVLEGPSFIKNKLAQVLVTLIYFEYPLIWPSVFLDYLPHLSKGALVIDMFCRVLNALDDELISLDYNRSAQDLAVAGQVKDAMRQQCVPQIVKASYGIIVMYKNSDPEICTSVLDSMRRYISWIDIELIANHSFIPLLFELILVDGSPNQLRGAAVVCVLAVVSKRMEPKSKLRLLQNLQINRVFGLVAKESDSELVSELAALLIGYADEVLDCSNRLNSEDAVGVPVELLNEVLPAVFYVMQSSEVDKTFSIVQFLSSYVAMMKSLSPLREKQLLHVGQILEVIRAQIRYDPSYRESLDSLDKIGREEEDRMVEFRKDLFVLLRSVEAALSLLFAYGESVSDEAMRSGSGILKELVPMLLSTRFPCHSRRLVALVYLDTITRYMKFVQEHTEYIPMALVAFLDERGIHHPNVNVSRRASYLFMRVVKLLKAKLVPFIETILQCLQDKVSQFTSMDCASKVVSGSEDGTHIFEAIGLLIGMEDVPLEKQTDFLSALLTPLCQQVETSLLNAKVQNREESPERIANIQQIIMAINALSKGFSERLVTVSRPAIGLMFKQTLDVLLQILVVYPKIEPLRYKVTSFIHRMVDILGTSVLPYLPKALEQLFADTEPNQMVHFLVLLNQLICKFKTAIRDILEGVYPAIASRIFSILPSDAFPSGPGSNTEEIRELQELQNMLHTFLNVIATHELSSVFLSPKSRAFLAPMMQLLLYTSCNHKDIFVRKSCVQIFIRLIKDWCSKPCGEEKVPGFQNFVIETFATNCCLYSVLDKSFELSDANTLILFGEIVLAQKVMYDKFGNDFLVHFVYKVFPTAHCPQDLVEQYCQKLQGNDMKALKASYQTLIENLRQQRNGSLVFR